MVLDTGGRMGIIGSNKYPVKVFGGVSFKGTAITTAYLWSKALLVIANLRPLTGIQRRSYCQEHFTLMGSDMLKKILFWFWLKRTAASIRQMERQRQRLRRELWG